MEETLTLTRLGIDGKLAETLSSTNCCESMISVVRTTQRNVKRWRDGEMALRWTAAGMLEAERQFRRVIGYRDLGKLAVAVEREVSPSVPSPPPARRRGRQFAEQYGRIRTWLTGAGEQRAGCVRWR